MNKTRTTCHNWIEHVIFVLLVFDSPFLIAQYNVSTWHLQFHSLNYLIQLPLTILLI
jgi:hypothetical protein